MLGSKLGLLLLWQSDALTTRLDLLQIIDRILFFPRDFVNLRHWALVDGVYVSAGVSVQHPAMPPQPKRIRCLLLLVVFVVPSSTAVVGHQGLATKFHSEKFRGIGRLGTVSVIPRKKVHIPRFTGRVGSEARNRTEKQEKIRFTKI
jgi:hypothetical protein